MDLPQFLTTCPLRERTFVVTPQAEGTVKHSETDQLLAIENMAAGVATLVVPNELRLRLPKDRVRHFKRDDQIYQVLGIALLRQGAYVEIGVLYREDYNANRGLWFRPITTDGLPYEPHKGWFDPEVVDGQPVDRFQAVE